MISTKKKVCMIISIALVIILGYISINNFDVYMKNPFNRTMEFINPIFATTDSESNIYIIDNSMKRVVKIDQAGNVSFVLTGGESSNSRFYTALEVDVDKNGNVYILNNVLDVNGQYVEKEEIIRYTADGKFSDIVYSVEYPIDERPMRTGNLCSISVHEDYVYCYNKQQDFFNLIRINTESKQFETVEQIDFTDANNMIIDFATSHNSNEFYFTTKRGEIYKVSNSNSPLLIYSGSDVSVEHITSIPWEVEIDTQDNLYFSDLIQRSIRYIDPNGNVNTLLSHEILKNKGFDNNNAVFYRISLGDDNAISSIGNENIVSYSVMSSVNFFGSGCKLPTLSYIWQFFLWFQLIILAAAAIYIIKFLYNFFKQNPPKVLLQSIFMIIVISISTLFITSTIFNSFEYRYEAQVIDRISQAMFLTSRSIDGDVFQRIQKPEHFMNEDYRYIREQLHSSFNNNMDSWGEGFYGALYTVSENKPYVIMYYDDSKCPFFPLYEDGSELEYLAVFNEEITITSKTSDAEGDWLYGLTPLYNSAGEIVGILEIGTDLYSFKQENDRLRNNILMDTITFLIVLIFVMIEITILGDLLARKHAQRQTIPTTGRDWIPTGLDVLMIRPICFLIYAACFLSGSFVPLLMKQLYTQPIWQIPDNVVYALPLSAESLVLSLSSLVGGYIIDKKGWKPTFLIGLFILFFGQLLSALVRDALLFIMARSVSGMGMGLTFISMQNFVVLPSTEEERNDGISALNSGGFAGLNAGLITGGILAEKVGFSNVFYFSAGLVILCILFSFRIFKNAIRQQQDEEVAESQKSLLNFFLDYRILSFFLLLFLPVVICTMFIDYFFPLFAESESMSPAAISRSFLLNGLTIIYLGPVLSKHIIKRIGSGFSMLLAALITGIALIQFALIGSLTSALVAILLLGVGESFGITARVNYFSSTEAVAKLGHGKALGYYGLIENLGQVTGPIIYGLVIGMGIFEGIGLMGICFMSIIALFTLITVRSITRERKLNKKSFTIES